MAVIGNVVELVSLSPIVVVELWLCVSTADDAVVGFKVVVSSLFCGPSGPP